MLFRGLGYKMYCLLSNQLLTFIASLILKYINSVVKTKYLHIWALKVKWPLEIVDSNQKGTSRYNTYPKLHIKYQFSMSNHLWVTRMFPWNRKIEFSPDYNTFFVVLVVPRKNKAFNMLNFSFRPFFTFNLNRCYVYKFLYLSENSVFLCYLISAFRKNYLATSCRSAYFVVMRGNIFCNY